MKRINKVVQTFLKDICGVEIRDKRFLPDAKAIAVGETDTPAETTKVRKRIKPPIRDTDYVRQLLTLVLLASLRSQRSSEYWELLRSMTQQNQDKLHQIVAEVRLMIFV